MLNVLVLVLFVFVLIRVQNKWGTWPQIILLLLVLSSTGRYASITPKESIKWNSSDTSFVRARHTSQKDIIMSNVFLSKNVLSVNYYDADSTHPAQPYLAFTHLDGVSIGTFWQTASISISKDSVGNSYSYSVMGNMNFFLVGLPVLYSKLVTHTGHFDLP